LYKLVETFDVYLSLHPGLRLITIIDNLKCFNRKLSVVIKIIIHNISMVGNYTTTDHQPHSLCPVVKTFTDLTIRLTLLLFSAVRLRGSWLLQQD